MPSTAPDIKNTQRGVYSTRPQWPIFLVILIVILAALGSLSLSSLEQEYRLRFWDTFRSNAESAYLSGNYDEASKYAQRAIEQAQHIFNAELRLGISFEDLAKAQAANKQLENASKSYEAAIVNLKHCRIQSLNALDEYLSWHHLACCLCGLAEIQTEANQLDKAEPLFTSAISLFKEKLDSKASIDKLAAQDYIQALSGLGSVYLKQGKLKEAEPLFTQALTMAQQTTPPETVLLPLKKQISQLLIRTQRGNRVEMLMPSPHWKSLSKTAKNTQQKDKAEELQRKALQEAEQFGENDLRVAQSLYDLAAIHMSRAQLAQARQEYERCLSILDKNNNREPILESTLFELGEIYSTESAYAKAEPMFFRYIETAATNGKQYFPRLGLARLRLARIYIDTGKKDLAIQQVRLIEAFPQNSKFWRRPGRVLDLIALYRLLKESSKEEVVAQNLLNEYSHPLSQLAVAEALADNNKFQQAESAFRQALTQANKKKAQAKIFDRIYASYADFLDKRGKRGDAENYRKKIEAPVKPDVEP